ncbi:PAS domain-containing protein [Rhizobium sp. G21]|uniref:PAS domain-containing protein n=1 Tax=Rhizobium sp. G21 TaxID=2758439 RepID=UPI0015FEBFB3|nr:PAS domain-containing protein [Rhizobium sp. G21]MBB1251717.1 PAS domain-containing protein [Rhizobium sp. G21]
MSLLENLLVCGMWTYSIQTRDLHWSAGLYALLGLDPRTVSASRELYDLMIHPDDRLSHEELIERAESGGLAIRRFRMIRPDGRLLWLESRSQREYDRQGRLVLLHGVVQDVSDQEKVRSDAHLLATEISSIKKITGADFWRTDAEGRLIDTASWSRLTGETAERLRDHEGLPAIHPEDRQIVRETRAEGLRSRRAVEFTIRVRRADGEYCYVDCKVTPVLASDGELIEWHGMSWVREAQAQNTQQTPRIQGCHVRAARALLGITARDLAEAAGVSFSTIRRIEDEIVSSKSAALNKIEKELVSRGIVFFLASGAKASPCR